MSAEKNRTEAIRWLRTARYDLESAEILLDNKRYAHACFLAQQAAEKALKSLNYLCDGDGWGHSILNLIDALKELSPDMFKKMEGFREAAVTLDKFYIPTRYPNGLPDITPDVAYTEREAREGISLAKMINEAAARILK